MANSDGSLSMAVLSERGRRLSNEELRSILLRHATDDSRGALLDVGGGTGLLGESLSDLFARLLVLELNPGKLRYGAKRRREVSFICGSAQNIPLADDSIGTVVSVAAFHHFPNQDAALEEMRRVLRHNGRLLLAEIDISKAGGKVLRFIENRLMRGGSKFLAQDQLLEKVERHGFADATLDRTSRGYVIIATRDSPGGNAPATGR